MNRWISSYLFCCGGLLAIALSSLCSAAGVHTVYSNDAQFSLTEPSPNDYDRFGWELAETSDRIIVGEPLRTDGPECVLVFDRQTGTFQRRIVPNDPQINTYFGTALDADGNRLIVGSWYGNSAYMFDLATGQQLWKLTKADSILLGYSVAIEGNRALVGDPIDSVNEGGAAYIVDATSGNILHTLRPSDSSWYDHFGNDVAIDGGYAMVASPGDQSVYQYNLATGGMVRKLKSAGTPGSFGLSSRIAADNGRLIASSGGPVAYVFDLESGAQIQELRVPGVSTSYEYGNDVDISGDLAIVGARTTPLDGVFDVGVAYLFRVSTGELLAQFQPSQFEFNNIFGHATHLDGNTVLIGAAGVDEFRGVVHVFQIPEPSTFALLTVVAVAAGCIPSCRKR